MQVATTAPALSRAAAGLEVQSPLGWLQDFRDLLAPKGVALSAARQAPFSDSGVVVRFELRGCANGVPLLCTYEISAEADVALVVTVTEPDVGLVMRYRGCLLSAADAGQATQEDVMRKLGTRVQPSRVADALQEALARRIH